MFLHANLLHIAFNMYVLYVLGQMLEPVLGRFKFALVYLVSLLAGSLGALIVTPHSLTVGASGANLLQHPDTYAELGGYTFQTANDLGGLPYGTPLRITWGGHSAIAYKRDFGFGGGPVAGLRVAPAARAVHPGPCRPRAEQSRGAPQRAIGLQASAFSPTERPFFSLLLAEPDWPSPEGRCLG